MTLRDLTPFHEVPLAMAARIDDACDRFDKDWRAGKHPRIEDYLRDEPEVDSAILLRELLVTELERRARRGDSPRADEYIGRFPDHAELVDALFTELAETPEPCARDGSAPETERTERGTPNPDRPTALAKPEIPGYEILGELGRGGMGVVYKARALRLNRLVAIKMILAGEHAGELASLRFLREAEIVARLRHPNVVQIFDLGNAAGRPFLELEFVEGGNLSRALGGTPWPARRGAALVETLTLAVHEAHQQGIVHRDLKPSNVLLTADGRPKIGDFGLAKALDADSDLTGSGSLLGTPSYMAPEQSSGGAAAASPAVDVYALGAILYETLTGRPPFKAPTVLGTLEQVRSAEPVPPGRLVPGLPRAVETICLKCLEKHPGRRYPSAQALADDLRRFLDGRPVKARRVGAVVRFRLWCAREPRVAALLGLLTLVIGGSLIVSLWQSHRLREQVEIARTGLHEAKLARAVSDRNYAKARAAIDELTNVARSMAGRPELDRTRRQVFENILKFHLDLLADMGHEPAAVLDTAIAYYRVAQLRYELGQLESAEDAYRSEASLLERLLEKEPNSVRYLSEMAMCQFHLAVTAGKTTNGAPTSRGHFERSIALCERVLAIRPEEAGIRSLLAAGLLNLAIRIENERGIAATEREFRRIVALNREVVAASPANATFQSNLALSLETHAGYLWRLGRREESETACREALALYRPIAAKQPDRGETQYYFARILSHMADPLLRTGRYDEAHALRGEAIAVLKTFLKTFPDHVDCQVLLARTASVWAIYLPRPARTADALDALRTALKQYEKLIRDFPEDPSYTRGADTAHLRMGEVLFDERRDEALREFERVLAASPNDAGRLNDVAWCLANGKRSIAEDRTRAVAMAEEAVRLGPKRWAFWNTLAAARYRAGDLTAARSAFESAMKLGPNDDPIDWLFMAMICARSGEADQAREWLEKAEHSFLTNPPEEEEIRRLRAEAQAVCEARPGPSPTK